MALLSVCAGSVLAPQLESDTLKREVAQTTISFSDHRLVAPAAALAETRPEVGRRIIRRLTQVALVGRSSSCGASPDQRCAGGCAGTGSQLPLQVMTYG